MLSAEQGIAQPVSNRDYDIFYQGLRDERLLVQKCDGCGAVRNPPGPMCPQCRSLDWSPLACSGRGTVHSYSVHHHPPLPGFVMPHAVLLVDMEEGFRLLGSYAGDHAAIAMDMPVAIEFVRSGDVATYQFRAA